MKHRVNCAATLYDSGRMAAIKSGMVGNLLKGYWQSGGTETELGLLSGFSGRTSYHGSSASLLMPFPSDVNPRGTGGWNGLLSPSDSARVRVTVTPGGSGAELPLFLGVPSPDGVSESYRFGGEGMEIKLEDVTGVASRMEIFGVPASGGPTIDPLYAAKVILSPLKVYCFYPLLPVDSCIEVFPNALMAADNILIKAQDEMNPLTGYKRIRYGDRNGNIIYRLMETPEPGQPFTPPFPAEPTEFMFDENNILSGLKVEPAELAFSIFGLNPYIDLGGRAAVTVSRAALSEVTEFKEVGWRLLPGEESMSIKGVRENRI